MDGRKDLARYLGDVQGYHAYRLPLGRHALDYMAAPFPTVHCTLSVPRSASDTCKMPDSRELANHPIGAVLGALDMGATVLAMDSHVRAKLQTLLEHGSSYPTVSIQPGTHYRDQHGNAAIAQEPMTVAMSVGVAPPGVDYLINDDGQTCGEFCAPSEQNNPLAWTLLPRRSYAGPIHRPARRRSLAQSTSAAAMIPRRFAGRVVSGRSRQASVSLAIRVLTRLESWPCSPPRRFSRFNSIQPSSTAARILPTDASISSRRRTVQATIQAPTHTLRCSSALACF